MKENTIITLDNNESYLIVSELTIDFINYYYLCSTTKPIQIKIAVIKNNSLEFVEEKKTLTYVFNKFVKKMKDELNINELGEVQ